jgi:hypothetical protein
MVICKSWILFAGKLETTGDDGNFFSHRPRIHAGAANSLVDIRGAIYSLKSELQSTPLRVATVP